MTALRSRVGFVLWPLAVAAVLGHLGLGVLAVVEYARLDWLVSVPYEFTAVTVVAGSGLLAVRRELAADRAATTSTGVAAVAGALLKLADLPTPAAVAAVNPAGNLPDRIAQLEGHPPVRRPRLGWLLAGATLANLGGLSAAAICCAGLGVAMAGGMT